MPKTISLLIPAYNEENRIEPFLREVLGYAKSHPDVLEVIVVNDGSSDKTRKILEKYSKKIRILLHAHNKGKGAAIKTGCLAAKGGKIIFLDADGSIPAKEIPKMAGALDKFEIAVGSRKAKGAKITVKQPLRRVIAGKAFNFIVNILFPINNFDTLCGFKGMRKRIGKEIASELISTDWVFDVEILARAQKKGIKVGVIPLEWKHMDDSKMRLGGTSLKMFLNLLKLRKALR
ncbi:MAG: glycosyltransferase [Candidatus Diapherotrites archaeon]|nr:glycosyltransferase [Candidatus Diapherotrites archaeon]